MSGEEAWKKHLELDEKLRRAEIRFARAVLNYEANKGEGMVLLADVIPFHEELLFSRVEMKSVEQEYLENLEYLDSIGFAN